MARKEKAGKAMIFGVFDRLHPGHLYLLYHARLEARELVAVIARDGTVERLKGRRPEWSERRRMRAVKATGLPTAVLLGDKAEGEYSVIKKQKPDLICLGYDQAALKKDLRAKMKDDSLPAIPLYSLKPYRPKRFHTSLQRPPS